VSRVRGRHARPGGHHRARGDRPHSGASTRDDGRPVSVSVAWAAAPIAGPTPRVSPGTRGVRALAATPRLMPRVARRSRGAGAHRRVPNAGCTRPAGIAPGPRPARVPEAPPSPPHRQTPRFKFLSRASPLFGLVDARLRLVRQILGNEIRAGAAYWCGDPTKCAGPSPLLHPGDVWLINPLIGVFT
jgi:hypothetical protein